MPGCCCDEDDRHLKALRERQARMLWAVLGINAVMFIIEFGAGWWAGSTSLLADSLDMLGDALVYALSLFVVARSIRWKAVSAGVKGGVMLGFGLVVLAEAVANGFSGHAPQSTLMLAVGMLALVANALCLVLLTQHRDDDVNLRSSWICSRNDLMANVGVIGAGVGVAVSGSIWPDLAVGVVIAALFLKSAGGVLRDARQRYVESHSVPA